MELKVPKCALKGLELSDVMFNDAENCALTSTEDEGHFTWKIDYTDCGTTKNVSFIKFQSKFSSYIMLTFSTFSRIFDFSEKVSIKFIPLFVVDFLVF